MDRAGHPAERLLLTTQTNRFCRATANWFTALHQAHQDEARRLLTSATECIGAALDSDLSNDWLLHFHEELDGVLPAADALLHAALPVPAVAAPAADSDEESP